MRCILAFFFLLFNGTLLAQLVSNTVQKIYNTDNGLPSNGIKGVQFDESSGFLWVATEAGIARFDGLQFKIFSSENTSFIKNERMSYLVRNHQNKIYSQDLTGNLFSIKDNILKEEDWFRSSANNFAIAVSDVLLENYLKQPLTEKFNFIDNKILSLTDTTFVVQKNNKLFFIENYAIKNIIVDGIGTKFKTTFKIKNKVYAVTENGSAYVYNTTNHKLILQSCTQEASSIFANAKARFFWNQSNANPILIIENIGYLIEVDIEEKITLVKINEAIPTVAYIQYAEYAKKINTLFLGTNSKGLIVLRNTGLKPMIKRDLQISERNAYYAQVELTNGTVLTNEGHTIGENTNNAVAPIVGRFDYATFLVKDSILFYSQKNNLLNNIGCLKSYNFKTRQTISYSKIPVNNYFSLVQLANGRIFFASQNGLGYLQGDTVLFTILFDKSKYNPTFSILESSANVLLLATCSGLVKYDLSSQKTDTIYKSRNDCVRALWKYKGFVFFGTYGNGYFLWKDGKMKKMPLDKNNYLRYVHCFIEDDNGFCWMSTNRGLFKAKLNDIITAYENNAMHIYYQYYGKNDGLNITELNGGCNPCALALKNRILSFPTMDGLLWVDANATIDTSTYHNIFVDAIVANNTTYTLQNLATQNLRATTREIEIFLGIPVWNNAENLYMEYKLADDKDWQQVIWSNSNSIRISSMESGKHTITIRKRNGFGLDNFTYQTIQFTIATPWYKHWLFFLLCTIIIVGLIYYLIEWRTKHLKNKQQKLEKIIESKTSELKEKNTILEKNNTIKTRLISIISHDIVTPLKFLTVNAKKLVEKKDTISTELQTETIQEIAQTSQELQLLSTNILNWIKYQNENRRLTKEELNVRQVVQQTFGVLNAIAKQKGLQLINAVPENQTFIQYFEPLKILIYNLLSNAINFTEIGTVTISCAQQYNEIQLAVTDTGVGLTNEQIDNIMAKEFIVSSTNVDNRKGNGLGFLIIKDLLKIMEASLAIESTINKGTTVRITF